MEFVELRYSLAAARGDGDAAYNIANLLYLDDKLLGLGHVK